MKSEKKRELGTGRVAFLARLEVVKEQLATGRTVMSVYRELEPQLGISYSQFDRYVIKFITGKTSIKKPEKAKIEEAKKTFLENHESSVDEEDII